MSFTSRNCRVCLKTFKDNDLQIAMDALYVKIIHILFPNNVSLPYDDIVNFIYFFKNYLQRINHLLHSKICYNCWKHLQNIKNFINVVQNTEKVINFDPSRFINANEVVKIYGKTIRDNDPLLKILRVSPLKSDNSCCNKTPLQSSIYKDIKPIVIRNFATKKSHTTRTNTFNVNGSFKRVLEMEAEAVKTSSNTCLVTNKRIKMETDIKIEPTNYELKKEPSDIDDVIVID